MSLRNRLTTAEVLAAHRHEIRIFGEQPSPGVAVASIPGPLQLSHDPDGDLLRVFGHAALPIALGDTPRCISMIFTSHRRAGAYRMRRSDTSVPHPHGLQAATRGS